MAVIKIATLVVVYSLALVVQLVVLVQAERMDYRLCDDEGQFVTDGRPGLTYKGSFKYMQTDGCDDYTIEAFNELRKLVDCNNVCSIEHANKVVQYSSRYLASKQLIKKLPPQLANFALLYGMRLSERCKELMMDGRLFRTNYIQETKEAKMLASWTVNNNPRIAELLEMGKKRVELKMRLPSQYSAVLAELPASNQNYKPELKLKDSETLKAAQMICNRFIRPLYERSMLPVAHLARNGFNYHNSGYLYQYAEDDDLSRQTLRLPSRLVFVCECLKQFKLTEPSEPSKTSSWLEIRFSPDDSSDAKLSASPSKNQMAIEDIAEISFDTGSIVPFEWDSKNTFEERRHYKYYFSGIDEISYKTNTDHVDELGPAVAAYDAKGGEIAKLRSELFHKSAHYLAKKVSADIIKELISVAAIQAADAISQVKMLNKSWLIALHQDNHEVDSYRKKLIKQVCPELMSRFYWTVSAMNESDDPKIRELARRVETLIISLDVALSFKYQNEAAYTEVDRSSVLLSVSGNVVFIADELRLEHEPI